MSSGSLLTPSGDLDAWRVMESPPVDYATVEYIASNASITEAWKKVRSNKGAPGVDNIDIKSFPKWIRPKWIETRRKIVEGVYKPSPALRGEIPKESGGMRKLGIPCVLDRVV